MPSRKRGHSGCYLYDYAQLVSSIFLRRTKREFATFDLCVSLIAFLTYESNRSNGSARRTMRILTIGSGGREHALVWALRKTATRPLELFCAPGNAGIAQDAECLPVAATNFPALIQLVDEKSIDLTIVGPEPPLAPGIVHDFKRRGLRIVGPESQAARLGSSKAFAKEFMLRHWGPTSRHRRPESFDDASALLETGAFGGKAAPGGLKA